MHLIKKAFSLLIVNAIVVVVPFIMPVRVDAQSYKEKEPAKACVEKAKDETMWMYKNLYLNADQYDRVKVTNLRYSCKADSIEHISDKRLASQQRELLKQQKDAEFKSFLSADQYQQYKYHKGKKSSDKKSPFSLAD